MRSAGHGPAPLGMRVGQGDALPAIKSPARDDPDNRSAPHHITGQSDRRRAALETAGSYKTAPANADAGTADSPGSVSRHSPADRDAASRARSSVASFRSGTKSLPGSYRERKRASDRIARVPCADARRRSRPPRRHPQMPTSPNPAQEPAQHAPVATLRR